MMKIAAQLYNVRDFTKTPEDIEATLRRIKSIGYNLIQISAFGPCDPALIARWVKEIGLEVCLTHTPWPRLANQEELEKVIQEHKNMNCPVVGLGSRPADVFENSKEGWTRFINKANEITKQVKDGGLDFSYHNHDYEFERWDGVTAMDRLINEVPDMLVTLDTFWTQAGGANPITYMKKLKGRIRIIHFKDYKIVNRTRMFAEIGQGNIEWDEIIPLCNAQGIYCAAIEQDRDWQVGPFESFAMSRDFLLSKGLSC